MRRLSASLLFFLAGTLTFAQTSSNPTTTLKVPTFNTKLLLAQTAQTHGYRIDSNFGCPVGFSASRQATGHAMSASDTSQSGPTQALHLILHRLSTPDIASIEVTVYGTAQKGPYLPVDSQSTTTVSKTFALHRISDSTTLSEAEVRMNLAGSLDWADLISITYADGTSWHATANFQCRAVASNYLLVGAK